MSQKPNDYVRLGPEVEPGRRIAVRQRGEQLSTGIVVPAKDGQAIPEGAEVVVLNAPGQDGWREVRSSYRHGPAQVATPAYSAGYERIFGKGKVGIA